jgi:hypothetical protein
LVGQVTVGQGGIILSDEATRLSRHGSDWYPLWDLCGYKGCLMADVHGLDDPSTANGRLLLGLKGPRAEWARQTIRPRMTAGLLHKAARGELALTLPTGLAGDAQGHGRNDANLEVQARLMLVLTTSLPHRSARTGREFFQAHRLRLPRRDRVGEVVGKRPRLAALLSLLKHPAYAGAFTDGRTRTKHPGTAPGHATTKRLPRTQWRIRVNDQYPAYLSWETFEQSQARRTDNHAEDARHKTRGLPRPGKALRPGLVSCGACGHHMGVQDKGGPASLWNDLRQHYRVPVWQFGPADPSEARVVTGVFEALSPVELAE